MKVWCEVGVVLARLWYGEVVVERKSGANCEIYAGLISSPKQPHPMMTCATKQQADEAT